MFRFHQRNTLAIIKNRGKTNEQTLIDREIMCKKWHQTQNVLKDIFCQAAFWTKYLTITEHRKTADAVCMGFFFCLFFLRKVPPPVVAA